MTGCSWFFVILWFFLLLILWPIGFLAAIIYVCISPFEACCTATCRPITDFIMKGVKLPLEISKKMVKGEGCK
jgi:hypothetical protein